LAHPLFIFLVKSKFVLPDIPTEQQNLWSNEASINAKVKVVLPVTPEEVWASGFAV
jgi:hypothetical protein